MTRVLRCPVVLLAAIHIGRVVIHDSAIRTPTPAPKVDRILTGHEQRQLDRCWRPRGTKEWLLLHTRSGCARVVVPGGEVLLVGAGETIAEADRLSASGLPHARRLAQNALEAALLWWDVRHPTGRPLDPRVLEAIDYVSRNPRRRLSVDELARVVHLSTSRFSHLFAQETALTPRGFVERQRIERAKQLLELTTLPVKAVAREVGFESQFYLATRFKKLTGATPSASRSSTWERSSP